MGFCFLICMRLVSLRADWALKTTPSRNITLSFHSMGNVRVSWSLSPNQKHAYHPFSFWINTFPALFYTFTKPKVLHSGKLIHQLEAAATLPRPLWEIYASVFFRQGYWTVGAGMLQIHTWSIGHMTPRVSSYWHFKREKKKWTSESWGSCLTELLHPCTDSWRSVCPGSHGSIKLNHTSVVVEPC